MRTMENAKDGQNAEKDLESQEEPINASNSSSSELKAEPEGSVRAWKKSPEKEKEPRKSAEVVQAQAQAEEFWRKIYNTMKSVETKEQAESLFKGLSSSKRVDNAPAKIEAQEENQMSREGSWKASELRAREKALAAEGFVDVKVDGKTPEMYPDVAKKVDEEAYVPDDKLLKKRRRRICLCCSTERMWCTLMLLIPFLVVFLVMYFVVLTPKDPTVTMEVVSLSAFKFAETGAGAFRMESGMNFTIRLKNPNRFADVVYDKLDVLLTYRTIAVGSVSAGVSGYKQQERNSTLIEVQLPKSTATITDAADIEVLKSEVANANVRVELRGMAEGHFRIARMKLGDFDTPVDCKLNVKPETTTESAVLLSASCYNRPG